MNHLTPTTHVRARGAALLMVLVLVAAASLMCWAMLGESAIRAQAVANVTNATRAAEHNEGGMQLAMYYLANPEKSEEGTVPGINGPYWPGGTYEMEGATIRAVVTPEPGNVFTLDVTTTADDVTHSTRQRVKRDAYFQATHALQSRRDLLLSTSLNISVNGGIKTALRLDFVGYGAAYPEPVVATNYDTYPDGSPPGPNAEISSAPLANEVDWLTATHYSHEGTVYAIEYHNNDIQNKTIGASSTNPLGVHRILAGNKLADTTINGTIICTGNLEIDKTVTVRAKDKMPAMVIGGELRMVNDSRLGVWGLVYTGENLRGTSEAFVRIQGALLLAKPSSSGVHNDYRGRMELIYNAEAARARDFCSAGGQTTSFTVLE